MAKKRKDEPDSFAGLFLSTNKEDNLTENIIANNDEVEKLQTNREQTKKLASNTEKRKSERLSITEKKIPQQKEENVPKDKETEKIVGRPKSDKETKKRTSLAFYPSVYSNLEKIAFVDREPSVNAIVDRLLEEYIEKNKDKLEEYERIMKDKVKSKRI